MVRVCQADEGIERQVGALLQQRASSSVGLVVGKLGSKDLALSLIATPDNGDKKPAVCRGDTSAAAASSSKGKKASATGKVALDLDEEWIAEHARQAGRMLPGGIHVIGLYFFGPEAAFSQESKTLGKLAAECMEAAQGPAKKSAEESALLLYADSNSRKILAKMSGLDGDPQAAQLKFMPLLESFVPLRCSYSVSLAAPATSSSSSLSKLLQRAVAAERERTMAAQGLLGSLLPADDALLADLAAQNGEGRVLEVSLLCPLPFAAEAAADLAVATRGSAKGLASLQGTLEARAYVYKRETWAAAMAELKADAVKTLDTRLEMLLEEEEEDAEEDETYGTEGSPPPRQSITSQESLAAPWSRPFPKRVGLPWKGPVLLCDYLYSDDTHEDARQHAATLLAFDPQSVEVVPWEVEAAGPPTKGPWAPLSAGKPSAGNTTAPAGGAAAKGAASSCNMTVLMCLAGAAGLASAFLMAASSQ